LTSKEYALLDTPPVFFIEEANHPFAEQQTDHFAD
jgi:hypothetical protein